MWMLLLHLTMLLLEVRFKPLAHKAYLGKVAISGQDADLAAIKRIVNGSQTMTVYKPITKLADKAAEIAVELGKNEKVEANAELNNGLKKMFLRIYLILSLLINVILMKL